MTVRAAFCAGAAIASLCAMPAWAQQSEETEIEALLDASASPEAAIALARKQAGEGDLLGAAATLERALLANPKAAAVRTEYVSLLCRLDDRQRAAIELAKDGGEAGGGSVSGACGTLPAFSPPGRAEGRLRGHVAAGLAYDSDASGALTLQLDVPGTVYPSNDGLAFIASAGLGGRARLGGGGFLYGAASGQLRSDISGPNYDYQIGALAAGLGLRGNGFEVSAGALLNYSRLQGARFLTEIGGEAEVAALIAEDTRLSLHGEIADQNFLTAPLISRDGTRYDLALSLQGGSAATFAYVVGAGWERKTAATDYLGYHGLRLYGGGRVPLGDLYATFGASYRQIDYYNSPLTRDYEESRLYGRAGLGVPLGGGLFAEGAGSYTRRDYNAASGLRDYAGWGGELRLVFRFGE